MIQGLRGASRRVGTISHPCPSGCRRCRAPAVSPHHGGEAEWTRSCRLHLVTAVAEQERRPGWGADALAGKLHPVPRAEGKCRVRLPMHLRTWRRSWDGWVLGRDPGSDTPPRQASPRRALERYFHAVVAAVEQMASEPSPSRERHLERLEEVYCSLLGPTAAARGRCGGKWWEGGRCSEALRSGDPAGGAREQFCTCLASACMTELDT